MATVDVLDSFISYRDAGTGSVPVVFLHGNPTSSYLWRNVIPHVGDQTRTLAPDLIGMGASGKPDIGYRFVEHARYLEAWFDALELDQVVLVGHDWGGALGLDWAARHPGRVRGVAVLETFLRPLRWSELPPRGAEIFRAYRGPEGERMVLAENMFIEFNLPNQAPSLTPEDHDVYRAPYPTPESRRPLLAWPRELPLDGEPADVVAIIENYGRWAATSPEVPKLIMGLANGSGLGSPEAVDWAATTFANAETAVIPPAGHHAPEDRPDEIGAAIAAWLRRHTLVGAAEIA
ncbi:haloalkane dehalogenase [Nocardia brasiliensis]|uniref:Haloalkane dehalogenase n=1 Tax=Nocardia brasiliensis (strain ATCC 700358 / HUJEG-1) TaxID=1133849 RepID=K0EUP9_NOCB7|nr:haloalkane dehalogenase [Nocardia brasiliensis]AFT99280.1 haloalkane dehalogenase [Nocardia brasiliensis ATCC 700358]